MLFLLCISLLYTFPIPHTLFPTIKYKLHISTRSMCHNSYRTNRILYATLSSTSSLLLVPSMYLFYEHKSKLHVPDQICLPVPSLERLYHIKKYSGHDIMTIGNVRFTLSAHINLWWIQVIDIRSSHFIADIIFLREFSI